MEKDKFYSAKNCQSAMSVIPYSFYRVFSQPWTYATQMGR